MLGSGVVGLTSARELQRHGFDVTIYAATVPPDTTSNMSLAGWTPTSGLVDSTAAHAGSGTSNSAQAVRIAYRRLQLLIGPKYGVTWITQLPADRQRAERRRGGDANPLLPAEHCRARACCCSPANIRSRRSTAIERAEMRIEPSIYLDALMNDFLLWGGKVVIRKFETPRDIAALSENVIVNCTGLGAKALFNDPELVPLKGQLVVLVPQPEITYGTSGIAPRRCRRSPASCT